MFDRIVVINLKRRVDRLERLWRNLDEVGWPFGRPTIFEAVDSNKLPQPQGWSVGGGAWGCMQSHRQVLERALMDDVKSLLVLEDDVYFVEGIADKMKAFMAAVPDDWEQLMIGGQYVNRDGRYTRKEIAPGVELVSGCERTHCYAVRGQFMRDLYAKWSGSMGHCDHVMGPFQRGRRVYAPSAFLAGQAEGPSDISGHNNPDKLWVAPPKDWPVTLFIGSAEEAREHRAKNHLHSGHNLKDEVDIGLIDIMKKPDAERVHRLRSWVSMIEWEGRSKTPERQCMIYGVPEVLCRKAIGDRLVVVQSGTQAEKKPCRKGCAGGTNGVRVQRSVLADDPSVWGPKKWIELHSRPDQARDLSIEKKWLTDFTKSVPCKDCRKHIRDIIKDLPPNLSNAESYFAWTVEAHNRVNDLLKRPKFSMERAQEARKSRAEIKARKSVCMGCEFYMKASSAQSPRCAKLPDKLKEFRSTPENSCPQGKWVSVDSKGIVTLSDLVRGKRVAIVGNAPTANSFEHANTIDSADVVIRFNRFETGAGFERVGGKTNVIAVPMGYTSSIPDAKTLAQAELVLAVVPEWNLTAINNRKKIKTPVDSIPVEYFAELGKRLGCRPTTGFATLCYILANMEPAAVYVTGMSFQRMRRDHYFDGEGYNYEVHDPVKEMHLFARECISDVITMDPHMQAILSSAQPSDEYGHWTRRNKRPYSAPHRWIYSQIAKHIIGDRVLEVGAGIGDGIAAMKGAASIVGIEPDPKCVTHLRKRFAGTSVRILSGTLEEQSDNVFDVAVCVEVVEHVSPLKVHDFLVCLGKRAKRLYLSSPDRSKHNHGVRTPHEWVLALKAAGWDQVSFETNSWACLFSCQRTEAGTSPTRLPIISIPSNPVPV